MSAYVYFVCLSVLMGVGSCAENVVTLQYQKLLVEASENIEEIVTHDKLMCSFMCTRETNCSNFAYNSTTKMCVIQGDVPSPKITPTKTGISYMYMFVWKTQKKIHINTASSANISKATGRSGTGLILVTSHAGHIFDVNFRNKSSHHLYTNFDMHANGIAYMSSIRRILVSSSKPNALVVVFLNGTQEKSIPVRTSYRIGVDDPRQIVFISQRLNLKKLAIYRMNVDGTEGRVIYEYRERGRPVQSMVTDSTQQILYAAAYDSIWSLTYDGMNLKTITKARLTRTLTMGATNDVIYYNFGKSVRRLSLSTKKSKTVVRSSLSVMDVVYSNGFLFYSPMGDTYITEVNLKSNNSRRKIKTKCKYKYKAMNSYLMYLYS